jgi:hypothetical protein
VRDIACARWRNIVADMDFHPERYRQYADGLDLPREQVDAAIIVLHQMMAHFVDKAFGHDATQLSLNAAQKCCGGTQGEHANLCGHASPRIPKAERSISNGDMPDILEL